MAIADKDNPLLRAPTPEEELAVMRIFFNDMLPKSRRRKPKKEPPRPAPTLESLQREVDELKKEIEKIHQGMFAASMDAALSR